MPSAPISSGRRQGDQLAINQTRVRRARIFRAQHRPEDSLRRLDEAQTAMQKLLSPGHCAFAAVAAERALALQLQGRL